MNYIKINKIKELHNEIIKLMNEFTDPLIDVRKQIENKEYILKKRIYKRPTIICGLNINLNRFYGLLMELRHLDKSNKHICKKYLGYGDVEDYYTKELYKIWIKL
jgi:hypothetical protein